MRINCGPTRKERIEAKEQWHDWFAWRPVRVGPNDCRWLETVRRKGKYWATFAGHTWDWEYRAKDGGDA